MTRLYPIFVIPGDTLHPSEPIWVHEVDRSAAEDRFIKASESLVFHKLKFFYSFLNKNIFIIQKFFKFLSFKEKFIIYKILDLDNCLFNNIRIKCLLKFLKRSLNQELNLQYCITFTLWAITRQYVSSARMLVQLRCNS